MRQRSQVEAPIVYQPNSESLETRRAECRRLIGEYARNLRPFAITSRERSVCDEVARGRSLSIDGLEILCELDARSENPLTFAKIIEGLILQRVADGPVCRFEASLEEQRQNAILDDAQLLAHREDTAVRWMQVWQGATQQAHVSNRLATAAWLHARRAS